MLDRFQKPFAALLRQGITPEKLALSVALGFALGIFPVLGSTTLLCAAVGLLLGLNQPALQSVNYLTYPLQLILVVPFYRLGERLFHAPRLDITVDGVKALIHAGIPHAVRVLWDTTLRAIVAWSLVVPLLIVVIYTVTRPLFRRLVVR